MKNYMSNNVKTPINGIGSMLTISMADNQTNKCSKGIVKVFVYFIMN